MSAAQQRIQCGPAPIAPVGRPRVVDSVTLYQGGVLALDLNSRSCGISFGGEATSAPKCATWKLPGCNDDDTLFRSLTFLRQSIAELSKLIQPRYVAIEAPLNISDRNPRTNLALIALASVAAEAGIASGAITQWRHVQTWRKHFTGSGRPDNPKRATQDRCRLLGWKFANEDEADSAGLWAYEMSIRFPKWAPTATVLFGRGAAA